MGISSQHQRFGSKQLRSLTCGLAVLGCLTALAGRAECQMMSQSGLLSSRGELTAAAREADIAASTGEVAKRPENAMVAAAIRQRLRDGDLQVGDRVIVTYTSDAVHSDTALVGAERVIELPGAIVVPVAGILRSELKARISTELLKYVKAQRIEVTPLMRVGVLGAVSRPGYFAFPSDIPLSDAIMGAGGLTSAAAVDRSTIRRRDQPYRSARETSNAIAGGLTLDQFGLSAGDEIVVGERKNFSLGNAIALTGAAASVVMVIVTMGGRR